jgi:hypothetical protein
MAVVSSSDTSVNICQITQRNIPEGIHLLTRGRENVKYQQERVEMTVFWDVTPCSLLAASIIRAMSHRNDGASKHL